MDVREAYDQWSAQYDTDRNRTRDLESTALREVLAGLISRDCLEIGCGTGKNTLWLAGRCARVTAVDLSPSMLSVAREKVKADHVTFVEADMLRPWTFAESRYDLVTFSLVLEHIEHLEPILRNVHQVLKPGGLVYIGELHPFKQYSGTKARFETAEGIRVVTCFDHHLSDFVQAAKAAGLRVEDVREFFDADGATALPRVLVLMLRK
ncbi:MAG: class I SAM-dependent methyltransferase [Flavobacteriales bacterium]|nr:class I SAM-dependent methyltransferase [Flavobacteriales bacterium]